MKVESTSQQDFGLCVVVYEPYNSNIFLFTLPGPIPHLAGVGLVTRGGNPVLASTYLGSY